jgi:regulator of protease activity HflC (stomatin/prohibitin superfamily)
MKIIKSISWIVIILIAGGWIFIKSLTVDIPIGKVGVRIQQYGLFGKQGVVEKDFGPGWHRNLGPIDKWELFDSTVQTLEMTRERHQGSARAVDDVKVQSADGYAISLDVTLKYQIEADKAHLMYQDLGSGSKYKTIVRNEAQRSCMGAFGTMKTEDFYNPDKRREAEVSVREMLERELGEKHIKVIDVLIRSVQFDPEYESKIRKKKLADQEVELNKSMAAAEEMSGKTQVIEAETAKLVQLVVKEKEAELIRMKAETDLAIASINANANRYVTEKQADADLIDAQKSAEGLLKVRMAEAAGEKLRNEALQGSGGDILVALEAAQNLNITSIEVSTVDQDFLDLNAMVKKLGAGGAVDRGDGE